MRTATFLATLWTLIIVVLACVLIAESGLISAVQSKQIQTLERIR